MSSTIPCGVTPDREPLELARWHNSWGWAARIWQSLVGDGWLSNDAGLNALWQNIESLPEWQQAPVVLTFDTGVIPYFAYEWTALQLEEFDHRMPAKEGHVNHIPAAIELFRSLPEVPLIGIHGTTVSENPFDPWDAEKDAPSGGIPLDAMYVLERHRDQLYASMARSAEAVRH